MAQSTCSVEGCGTKVIARGLCSKHYQRLRKTGDPLGVRPKGPEPMRGHGTVSRYTRGCRCGECRAASAARKRRYKQEHAGTVAVAARKYAEATKIHAAARKRADRMANPDKYRERSKAYARNNPEAIHINRLRRRAREAGADISAITAADWWRIVQRYRGCCAYCGANDRKLTRDHVIPLARGGRHSIGNIVPACGSCNYSKADRLLIEWRAWKQAINAAA